jgi:hypothetical protein
MHRLVTWLKRSTTASLMIMLMASCLPVQVFADDCVPPASTQPGVHVPTGADAVAFIYNCGTGMWESAHYIYDPATRITTPKDAQVYVYNSASGLYDVQVWSWHTPTSTYKLVTLSVNQPPSGSTVVGGPSAPTASISDTGTDSNNVINNTNGAVNGSSISGTGTNSNNTIDGTNDFNGTINNLTGATIDNQLNALATSGNSIVLGNTTAGGATSGNAEDLANIVNLLQSSSNALGGDTVTFVANIDGDVNGDFLLDPSLLGTLQNANSNSQLGNNLTLNNEVDASINNDINLVAETGDATVEHNTTAGDATTGNAKIIANIVNLINSAITSGNSFLGVININGNLNGDILLPSNLVDQLIAANVPTVTITDTGTGSNNEINTNNTDTSNITNSNDLGITNNVNATATTGGAEVSRNTYGGNATSGTASTSITAFNLTGSNIIGCNAILVFVNVSGSWVGLIVDAPPGATAAALGSCVQQSPGGTGNIDNDNEFSINNDINADARSGDAKVTGNTTGGNARSGNASTAVNLLNVQNSSLSLSGWFGILFINVFGNWNGSFGVNTAAGNPVSPLAAGGLGGGSGVAAGTPGSTGPGGFLGFIPSTFGTGSGGGAATAAAISGTGTNSSNVLSAQLAQNKKPLNNDDSSPAQRSLFLPITATIIFVIYIIAETYTSRRKASRTP